MAPAKREGRICQECLNTIYDYNNLNWYYRDKGSSAHYSIICDDCVDKLKVKQSLLTPFNKYKPKNNFIEGTPTKTGTKRFYFKKDDKIVLLTAESGIKKNLKPAKNNEIK